MPSKTTKPSAKQNTKSAFEGRLADVARDVEELLQTVLGRDPESGETARPARLLQAMQYAALAGGKRLRPFLLVESARLFGVKPQQAMMAAAAVECVHCYSLVHDDLPAMDDALMRRSRPSCHRAFGEATAILAGDALQPLAFEVLARTDYGVGAEQRGALVAGLAIAAGSLGMCGGQMMDLMAENQAWSLAVEVRNTSKKTIDTIADAVTPQFCHLGRRGTELRGMSRRNVFRRC